MSATAETVLLVGMVAAALGLLIAFPLAGALDRRARFEAGDFCGWFGVRLAAIGYMVAAFSTCGDIR